MKRNSPLQAKTPMKRGQMKRKPPKNPGFTRAVKNEAWRRADGKCEAGAPGCSGRIDHYHHRKLRSAGGPNTLANCLAVCHKCHHHIHHHRDEAHENGWIISAFAGQP